MNVVSVESECTVLPRAKKQRRFQFSGSTGKLLRLAILSVFLNALGVSFINSSAIASDLGITLPDVTLFSPVSLFQKNDKMVLLLDVNLIYGKGGGFVGLEAGGLMNKCGTAIGVQVAPINKTGSAPFLLQFGVDNSVVNSFNGIQIGIWNSTNQDYTSIYGRLPDGNVAGSLGDQHPEASTFGLVVGLHNTSQTFGGINTSFMYSHVRNIYGLQIAPFALATKRGPDNSDNPAGIVRGFQIGSMTWAYDVAGFQIGVVNIMTTGGEHSGGEPENETGRLFGLQAGLANLSFGTTVNGIQLSQFINYAEVVHGVQISFMNITQELRGVQIGILNIAGHALLPVMVGINVGF